MKSNLYRKLVSTAGMLGALAVASLVAPGPALAHHSFTMFDMDKEITITGVVKEFQWTNPHTFTWVEVTNADGSKDVWGLEGMSPNFLGRRGWSKHTLEPGSTISVVIHPLKEGKKGGSFMRCTLEDGTEMVMFGGGGGGN